MTKGSQPMNHTADSPVPDMPGTVGTRDQNTAPSTAEENGNHQVEVEEGETDPDSNMDIFCASISGIPTYLWVSLKSVGCSAFEIGTSNFPVRSLLSLITSRAG